MKFILLILFVFLFSSCDPYYKIQYSLKNQTTDTVYVKYMSFPDSLKVIAPGAQSLLTTKSGVGYAKEKFKNQEFQTWFDANSIVVKKTKENKIKKVSETKWKFEGGRVHGGPAILYVKN